MQTDNEVFLKKLIFLTWCHCCGTQY